MAIVSQLMDRKGDGKKFSVASTDSVLNALEGPSDLARKPDGRSQFYQNGRLKLRPSFRWIGEISISKKFLR